MSSLQEIQLLIENEIKEHQKVMNDAMIDLRNSPDEECLKEYIGKERRRHLEQLHYYKNSP
jgi:hypothetical protein